MRTYYAFVDPSGGSHDSMTLAVAHRSILKDSVLDGFWERRPPFSPDDVVREFAAILEGYRITKATGDRYSAQWVVERFREHGVTYAPSEKTRSELYIELVALVNARRVRIPGHNRLRTQILSLERRASRTGRDVVDHPPGLSSHDDVANSVAGALVLAAAKSGRPFKLERVISIIELGQPVSGAEFVDSHKGVDLNDPFQGDERFWHKL
jgi:hypothetical protein